VSALSLKGLTKRYDDGLLALCDFDLDIPEGTFFGLLGPNGAGKTTLISAVCNLIRITAGDIRIFGLPHDSLEAQRLARRWAELASRWMNGDIALMKRWRYMVQEQPSLPLPDGMDRDLFEYIGQAVQLRLALLAKYLSADELQRIDFTLDQEWRALGERAERLVAARVPPDSADARQLGHEWLALLDRMVRHDVGLRARLIAAYDKEPLLRASSAFSPEALHYMGLIKSS